VNDLNVFKVDDEGVRPKTEDMPSHDLPGSRLRFDAAERSYVYAVGRRYVRDADAADDVAQEAMLLAFRHRDAFRGDSHPRTWLYRIATTTALGYLRRQRRRDAWHSTREVSESRAVATEPAADEALAGHELAVEVQRGLAGLDEKYASVMRLRADDLRDHEIASQLGISTTAVKVRAHRARAMLRVALAA